MEIKQRITNKNRWKMITNKQRWERKRTGNKAIWRAYRERLGIK